MSFGAFKAEAAMARANRAVTSFSSSESVFGRYTLNIIAQNNKWVRSNFVKGRIVVADLYKLFAAGNGCVRS